MTNPASTVAYVWAARGTVLICAVLSYSAFVLPDSPASFTDLAIGVLFSVVPWFLLLLHSFWRPANSFGLMRGVGISVALVGALILWFWLSLRSTAAAATRMRDYWWDTSQLLLLFVFVLILAALAHLGRKRLAVDARRPLAGVEALLTVFCVGLLAMTFLGFSVGRSYSYRWQVDRIVALRAMEDCARTYATRHPALGFPPALANLPAADTFGFEGASCLQAQNLADGEAHHSYFFVYVPGPPDSSGRIATFSISARPVAPRPGRDRHYFLDHSGILRATTENRAASSTDPPAR